MFEQTLLRPLRAFLSVAELLGRRVSGGHLVDGMLSRVVHILSSPYGGRQDSGPGPRGGGRAPAGEGATRRRRSLE